jgi:hypothetical protein
MLMPFNKGVAGSNTLPGARIGQDDLRQSPKASKLIE